MKKKSKKKFLYENIRQIELCLMLSVIFRSNHYFRFLLKYIWFKIIWSRISRSNLSFEVKLAHITAWAVRFPMSRWWLGLRRWPYPRSWTAKSLPKNKHYILSMVIFLFSSPQPEPLDARCSYHSGRLCFSLWIYIFNRKILY